MKSELYRTQDGVEYRDLNKNGRMDPYEDPRIPIEVPRVDYEKLSGNKLTETSEAIRQRVQTARNIQQTRFANPNSRNSNIISNADMRIGEIRQFCQLQAEGGALTVRLSLTVSKCQSLMRSATLCCA